MTDTTTQLRSVLVYDGDCPFCSAAASALRRLDDAGAVPWENESAQRFLDEQFGETPFALAFVDGEAERVWLGESAAEELCTRAGLPTLVRDVVGDNYETIADAVRRATGADGDPDPYHGEFPLSEEAAARFDDLASDAEQTHRPEVDAGRRPVGASDRGRGRTDSPGRNGSADGASGRRGRGASRRSDDPADGNGSRSSGGDRTTDDVPSTSRRHRNE